MMNLKYYQRILQRYYQDRVFKWADLENEVQYNLKNLSLYSHIVYAHKFGKIRDSSTRILLDQKGYAFSFGHTFKKVLKDAPNVLEANDIGVFFRYDISDHFEVSGGFTYSLNESSSKQWRLGGKYHQDCWGVSSSIRQDITPRPNGFTRDNAFYIQFNFAPFGSVGTGAF